MIKSNRIKADVNRGGLIVDSNQPTEQIVRFSTPILGLITSQPLDSEIQNSCCLLENFIPTTTGVRVRGGSRKRVKIPNSIKYIFSYNGIVSTEYFVANDANVYKYTDATADGTVLTTPSIASISNSDYSHLETQTDAGSFLLLVNGADNLRVYNGINWQVVTNVSTPFSITGVNTNVFNFVWNYNNRVFYIEENSFNAWYLPVNSIGGAAVKLPLTGIFKKGGFLLFGATLSSDSGSGFDDRCIFVTTKGEFAVYSGDPASADNFSLNGIFDIGEVLGKNAFTKVYGDVLVATKNGFLSVNAIMQKQQTNIEDFSKNIKNDWQRQVINLASNDTYQIANCNNYNLIYIATPSKIGITYVYNTETQAWSIITGWSVNSIISINSNITFGGFDGWVYLGDTGGFDDTKIFEAKLCFNFQSLGGQSTLKTATRIKQSWRFLNQFINTVALSTNYNITFNGQAPVVGNASTTGSNWDTTAWDANLWGTSSDIFTIKESWSGASGYGEFFAPTIQITSGQSYRLDCELISIDLAYKQGRNIV